MNSSANKMEEHVLDKFKIKAINLFRKMSFSFIHNEGQMEGQVKYYIKKDNGLVFFTGDRIVFSYMDKKKNDIKQKDFTEDENDLLNNTNSIEYNRYTFSLDFLDADPKVEIDGINENGRTVSYFKGNDKDKWHTGISTFEKIIYRDLWDKIDLCCTFADEDLKFEYIVKPGGKVDQIKLVYKDVNDISMDEGGNILINSYIGRFIDKKPEGYQIFEGKRKNIKSDFKIVKHTDNEFLYGFEVKEEYDRGMALIIDPEIVYSSYLGGSGEDEARDIAVDRNGNVYIIGNTESEDFPIENGFTANYRGNTDAFVAKIDSTPAIVYSFYLGGSSYDLGFGIAVDEDENVYITGQTSSEDFPLLNAFDSSLLGGTQVFVTKINSTPAIEYSSFLGGSSVEVGNDIAVDRDRNVYITGTTQSVDFPLLNAFDTIKAGQDEAFITKINSTPEIVYSSYLGGSALDRGIGIALDENENVYVTGFTRSADFPILNAFQSNMSGNGDAFIAKIDSTPAIVFSSYLGGSGNNDSGSSVAVDQEGNVYITGNTDSRDFPMVNAFQPNFGGGNFDIFVTKISPAPTILYSSYLGGSGSDFGNGIAVDRYHNAYIIGETGSSDFPVVNPLYESPVEYGSFIVKIDSRPGIVFSSYFGGTARDEGYGISLDQEGNIYIAGYTLSVDLPVVNAFCDALRGRVDAFVTKISFGSPSELTDQLTDYISQLPISDRAKTKLLSRLSAIKEKLANNNNRAAIGKLRKFIHNMRWQILLLRIPNSQGRDIIHNARNIIKRIRNNQ